MIQHRVEIIIHRPVEKVFAFLTDATRHPSWDTSSVAMEPQEAGDWRTGLKFREVRRIGGRETEVFSQIAYLEPNHRFDMKSLTGPDFEGHWSFEPAGAATRLRWNCQMKLVGFARLFEPLIARQFKQATDANFMRLKGLLEETA